MLAVKKGDNEIERRRQKEGFVADVLGILKTDKGLAGNLDREGINTSEFWKIQKTPLEARKLSYLGWKISIAVDGRTLTGDKENKNPWLYATGALTVPRSEGRTSLCFNASSIASSIL